MDARDIIQFCFALDDAEEFETSEDVIAYLKKPSLWSEEFEIWADLGRPRSGSTKWNDFTDMLEERAEEE